MAVSGFGIAPGTTITNVGGTGNMVISLSVATTEELDGQVSAHVRMHERKRFEL